MEQQSYFDPSAILWSKPIAPNQRLLVLMHGRGSDEADLFGLTHFLPTEPVIASIRAPTSEGPGFSWYRMDTTDLSALASDVDRSVHAVLDWLDSLPPVASVGLLGSSQGGAMALQLMRHRPHAFSYVVQLSGFVIDGTQPGDVDLADLHVPVFWGRGEQDMVIPTPWIERTAAWLPAHADLDAPLYQTAHSITELELADVAEFIRTQLELH